MMTSAQDTQHYNGMTVSMAKKTYTNNIPEKETCQFLQHAYVYLYNEWVG